jgi:hypothetical protein
MYTAAIVGAIKLSDYQKNCVCLSGLSGLALVGLSVVGWTPEVFTDTDTDTDILDDHNPPAGKQHQKSNTRKQLIIIIRWFLFPSAACD